MKNCILYILVIILLLGVFSSCRKKLPLNGGIIDNTKKAPKVINSKDIQSFRASFSCYNLEHDNVHYSFEIEKKAEKFVLRETDEFNIECEVSDSVLKELQDILDRYKLVELNGVDRYTSALPPPYDPLSVHIIYNSGESLYFRHDGDPDAGWLVAMVELFGKAFTEKGYSEFMEPEEDKKAVRFDIAYNDGSLTYLYMLSNKSDGEKVIMKSVYDEAEKKEIYNSSIAVPDGFFEGISEIADETGIRKLLNGETNFSFSSGSNDFIEICIEVESGKQYNGFYIDEEIDESVAELIPVFTEYMDKFFDQEGK